MLVTPTTLANLQTTFSHLYQGAFDAQTPISQDLATFVPSETKSNTFGWMTQLPRLREWLGARVAQNLSSASYTITNRDFELTIAVRRPDIEDDNLGIYTPTLTEQGRQAKLWPDDLFYELLANGETAIAFDGQHFFDTSHPIRVGDPTSPTYSNLRTGTPLNAANYRLVRQSMRKFLGADGRSLRVKPTHLYVPPELEGTAKDIVQAERLANGATNTDYNTSQIVVLEDAQDATSWYLADNSRAIRPFVIQIRRQPQFTSLVDPNNPHVFELNEFKFGVDARGNGGYGLPFLCVKAKQ